jgi:hypothetical protein
MTAQQYTQSSSHYEKSIQIANMLGQKAMQAVNKEALIFVILNDTIHMIRYDRALLWDISHGKPKLLGISGESKINANSRLVSQWIKNVQEIVEPSRAQILSFTPLDQNENKQEDKATLLWLPIYCQGKVELGLWLELWNTTPDQAPPHEMIKLLINFLMPVYGIAWEKYAKAFNVSKLNIKKWIYYAAAASAFLLTLIIQIPLRVVAPCEIVPKNPILVTAPLEGIIENIDVKPGERVKKGDRLFSYDREGPLHELEVEKKQVEILISEIKRASTVGFNDLQARKDLSILTVKLEKEKADLELAQYRASQLYVKAPEGGVVMLDNPDEWRGNPVKIGEKVLAITEPGKSKIKMWLPESDNVTIDPKNNVKIFLNVSPEKSYSASLTYIANESVLSEKHIPSFLAEAEWIRRPDDIRLGLKGTAVLYGEKVSLFYYVIRKPWSYLRTLIGF